MMSSGGFCVQRKLTRPVLQTKVGIFSDKKITPRGNALDTLCATLEEKMQFEEGERDLVVSTCSKLSFLHLKET